MFLPRIKLVALEQFLRVRSIDRGFGDAELGATADDPERDFVVLGILPPAAGLIRPDHAVAYCDRKPSPKGRHRHPRLI